LIVAFGASLNYWTTRNRDLFASSARILQCDRNSAAIGALTSADFGLVGDVAETAKALSQELAQRGFSAAGFRIPDEAAAMERTLQVDPKGIELILGLISKTTPQAASAKAQDFYDPRFFTELRDSGFLKKLWAEK